MTKNPGPIGPTELDFLLDMLKQKVKEPNINRFLLHSYQVLIETMKYLLDEMSLAKRYKLQIKKLDKKVSMAEMDEGRSLTLERVVMIAMRTKKLFSVRDDLVSLFRLVMLFEQQIPHTRQLLL